jgi:hypothetical protein
MELFHIAQNWSYFSKNKNQIKIKDPTIRGGGVGPTQKFSQPAC